MTRSRVIVSFSAFVVALGALIGVGALVLSPARAAVGPLPAEALVLPADAHYVIGLDVKRFVASPFYLRYAKERASVRPATLDDLEAKTGINWERDLERVIAAGSKGPSFVVMVTGTFDRHQLTRHIEQQKGVTHKKLQGDVVYLFNEGKKETGALAFLNEKTLLLGDQASVEATIDSQAQGKRPIRSNAAMVDLLTKVKPGSTFWMVGDETLLADMPKGVPIPGTGVPGVPRNQPSDAQPGGGMTMALPPLKSLTVTADLESNLAFEATGTAADEATAQKLADVVRGLVALASLQAQQKPELQSLTSAINISTEATKVHLNARISYETLDTLAPKKPAPTPAPKQ